MSLETPQARARLRRELENWPDGKSSPVTINQGLELLDMVERMELIILHDYRKEVMRRTIADNGKYRYLRIINWVCLALGIKSPEEFDLKFGDGDKKIIQRIKEIAAKQRQLEKEADWLADHLCDIACTRDVRPCEEHNTCRECWRQAAREGAGGENESCR